MGAIFDVDAEASAFEPLVIRFRGAEYQLGATAVALFAAMDAAKAMPADPTVADVLAILPAALRAVCPELAPALDAAPLGTGEEVALCKALTEVMRRAGRITFQAPA